MTGHLNHLVAQQHVTDRIQTAERRRLARRRPETPSATTRRSVPAHGALSSIAAHLRPRFTA